MDIRNMMWLPDTSRAAFTECTTEGNLNDIWRKRIVAQGFSQVLKPCRIDMFQWMHS